MKKKQPTSKFLMMETLETKLIYIDEKFFKIEGHISYIVKEDNEFKLLSNRQSVEEVLIQSVGKTSVKILYDNGLSDNYHNAHEILCVFLFVGRRRADLKELNNVIQ